MVRLFEPFLTESAGEGSLLGVAAMMGAQLVLAAKPLLTLAATQPGRSKIFSGLLNFTFVIEDILGMSTNLEKCSSE